MSLILDANTGEIRHSKGYKLLDGPFHNKYKILVHPPDERIRLLYPVPPIELHEATEELFLKDRVLPDVTYLRMKYVLPSGAWEYGYTFES